jgi:RNA polymerase sigma-70 factor (ECF subfamily)
MAILHFPVSRQGNSRASPPEGGDGVSVADNSSFAQMWQELRPALRRHLMRQLGSVDAAEDAVQETFLRMLRYQAIDNPGERRALLFRVAASVVADSGRNAKSRRANDHCTLDDQELVSEAPQPDRNLANHQNLVSLQRAILALPPRCREVFLLHRFEGLSYRDIARRFGTSERTVENQISHALAVCRRALA